MLTKKIIPVFLLWIFFAHIAAAVESACSLQIPRLRVKRPDIFTDQQEQWLGDAQAEMIEPRYTLLPAYESTYLDEIGQRLLKQLPPTPIRYTFRIYESPDLRAFSLAGGHVYISRKLVMDARNEDELAAMLAQEIGRIYIHHAASAVTRRMQRTMHVKELGDRADVDNKFLLMLNLPPDPYSFLDLGEQRDDELLADRVGMYAMIKAQYDPKAFAAFLDRVNNNGGYTGSLFTEAFDLMPLVSLRVRMADKLVSSLPGACHQVRPAYRPGFKPFQLAIQQQRIDPIVPASPGLHGAVLDQPIQPALENIAISPDGNYVLAQDAYKIHVLSAAPLKLQFSINALGAEMAQFSPDSQSLVFNYNDLHIEKWHLATGQPSSIQDFVDYAGCVQTSLSPDGNALACISQFYGLLDDSVWLKIADIHSGSMLYQNLHFFDKGSFALNSNVRFTPTFQAVMHWSRDGRYFVAASGSSAMAYDLTNRATVRLGGVLSGLAQQRFDFVGSDKMVSTCDWSVKTGGPGETFTMCYTTFPAGKSLKSFQLPPGWLASVAAGDHLVFGPLANSAAGLLNPATAKLDGEFRNETLDVRGDELAGELPEGGIAFGKLQGNLQALPLPVTPLTAVETADFSLDGRYLALSNRARGAEWDLSTGKRMKLTLPFLAAAIDNAGNLQAAPVSHEIVPASDPGLDKLIRKYVPWMSTRVYPLQWGSVRIRFVPLGVQQEMNYDVRVEADDASSEAHLWSRTILGKLPRMIPADGDKTLFVIGRESWTGSGKLLHTSDLPLQFLNPLGTVVEVVSNRTGKADHLLFSPQLPVPDQSRDERSAQLFGSLLAVYGNNNDTAVYRVGNGSRLFAFFGRALAGDDTLGMLVATDRIQELNLYETAHGARLAHLILDQAVLAARFIPQSRQLLVLTASQRLYRIDLSSLVSAQPPSVN